MAAPQMIVVFSGFRNDDLKNQIETCLNGKVTTVLSKNTTHLIIKADAKPSQKLEKAYALGLEVNILEAFVEKHKLTLPPKEKKPRAPKAKKALESETPSCATSESESEEMPVQIVTSDNESSDSSSGPKKAKKQKKMIDPEVLALKIKIAAVKKELAELQSELKAKTAKPIKSAA